MWTVLFFLLYLFGGVGRALNIQNCGSGFWCCWQDKVVELLFWPLCVAEDVRSHR